MLCCGANFASLWCVAQRVALNCPKHRANGQKLGVSGSTSCTAKKSDVDCTHECIQPDILFAGDS